MNIELKYRNLTLCYIFIIQFILVIYQLSFATSNQLNGIIIDSESGDSIFSAHIFINNKLKATTDLKGRFSIHVNSGDTIIFSHLGFIQNNLVVTDSVLSLKNPIIIYFKEQNYRIKEVKIFPFKDYTSFKQTFLNKKGNSDLILSEEEAALIKKEIIRGTVPTYDSYMNFRHELRQQQNKNKGITLYTSNGQGGVNRLFRKRRK